MYLSTAIMSMVAVAPLIKAHDGVGVPKILGLDAYAPQTRDLFRGLVSRFAEDKTHENHALKDRKDGRDCGEGIGSCKEGLCCSVAGYCGSADSYCYSPGCNYQYGPGCAENNPPKGTNTSSFPRDKVGSVAYGGTGTFKCKTPGSVAITYDDGPMKTYTSHILDLLKSHDAKATFFITGNNINKGQIDTTEEYRDVIKRMDTEGHQIASHTWTHLDLSKISSVDRKNQLWMNEMAIRNIVDKIPTYMRPPYSSCTSDCQNDMADLGYHVTYFDLNGDDYEQNTKEKIQLAKDWWQGNITEVHSNEVDSRRLSISHDILEQTANNLTGYMLDFLAKNNFKAVTVGECLGDPKSNWYRTANGISSDNSTKTEGDTNEPSSTTSAGSIETGSQTGAQSGSGSGSASAGSTATGAPTSSATYGVSCAGLVLSIAFMVSCLFAF
ncbi:glycoside hydrolase/deacetylase [Massarina eburnea CBS 473.64]|uniref:Glycoside hydrolase/deacetylase n=1 Tax=Massarina eburnea CBS 473.64 TaxID=1395130 RepID=A0A6A6S889_9PLEO|nr:glycoside hydrolase/deacetylase [Massarina eburnea CBS 473.64]